MSIYLGLKWPIARPKDVSVVLVWTFDIALQVCSLTLRLLMSYMYIYIYVYDISSLRVNDLTLILLTRRKWWTPNNASKWQMGFNSGFKGLKMLIPYSRITQGEHKVFSWLQTFFLQENYVEYKHIFFIIT